MRWRIVHFLCISFVCVLTSYGQLSVPPGFPAVGDTVNMIRVEYDGLIDTRGNARNLSWNFMFLNPSFSNETLYRHKSAGRYHRFFPEANLVVLEANGKETYYNVTEPNIYEVGSVGDQFIFNNVRGMLRYQTSPIFKKSGLKYDDRLTDVSQYSIKLPTNGLEGLESAFFSFNTDTIRLDVSVRRERIVDAEGELLLPFSNHKVIREREDVMIEYSVLSKTGIGWVDISDRFLQVMKGQFPPSNMRLTNYYFWSGSYTIPILTIKGKPRGGWILEFPDENLNSNLVRSRAKEKDILAHPNPTFGDIQFHLVNYPKGTYALKVYNIVGRPIFSRKYSIGDTRKIEADLSFLSKGTYLYSIIDDIGNKLVTKKLVILRP